MSDYLLTHSATVLSVTDFSDSLDFYTRKLGFKISYTWNDPVEYAVLKRDEISVHLNKKTDDSAPSSVHNALYIFTNDLESLYQEFLEKDVKIHSPLTQYDYGMKEFDIMDPEGYILSFGKEMDNE